MLTVQNQEEDVLACQMSQKEHKDDDSEKPVIPCVRKDFYETLLTDATNDLSPEMLKKLGIYIIYGTMMKISIVQITRLWKHHRGKMFEVMETLEKVIKEIVEDMQQGLLVKITPDAFICFFPDKPQHHSILRSLYSACTLQMHMLNNPIYLEDDLVKVQICISYGPIYKRALHIQRKVLYDYYGEVVDDLLYRVNQMNIPKDSPIVTVCNTDPKIKEYIKDVLGEADIQKMSMRITKKAKPKTLLSKTSKDVKDILRFQGCQNDG